MKENKLKPQQTQKMSVNYPVNSINRISRITLLLTLGAILITGCSKNETQNQNRINASVKDKAAVSYQPLPGGKSNFSVAIGRFATSGAIWVRMVNWTFDDDAGTVAATFWQWDTTQQKGKTAFNSHTCTFDNLTKTCFTYTPTGWLAPAAQYTGLTGTYTYNTSTGALSITWSGGASENWTITNPTSAVARAVFVSSAGTGYAVTHGRGYGSNRPWTGIGNYATIGNIPQTTYSGYYVLVNSTNGARIFHPSTITPGAWQSGSLSLATSTTPSSPTPANALHFWTQTGGLCDQRYYTDRIGNVYHLASNNNGRSMVYNHFKACLPVPDANGNEEFPCYSRGLHPYAFQQIIDDNGNMKGFVGIEQQDEYDTLNNFQYQLIDYTTIP